MTTISADHGVETHDLVIDDVGKVFTGGAIALQNASLTVRPGEFVALVGPSGCGKSTLLRLIAGLDSPTSGRIRYRNRPSSRPRADIGFMFQKPTLLPWKSALQNVLVPATLTRDGAREAQSRAYELLDLVGLTGFEHHYPSRLSGGMQQRVALARLLMTGADLLLLDEPFGALDEFTRERLNLELLRLHAEFKHTTLFVTHNISEAVFLADRVVVMSARPGRVEDVVHIEIPRPREVEVMRTTAFTDYVFGIRSILDVQL